MKIVLKKFAGIPGYAAYVTGVEGKTVKEILDSLGLEFSRLAPNPEPGNYLLPKEHMRTMSFNWRGMDAYWKSCKRYICVGGNSVRHPGHWHHLMGSTIESVDYLLKGGEDEASEAVIWLPIEE